MRMSAESIEKRLKEIKEIQQTYSTLLPIEKGTRGRYRLECSSCGDICEKDFAQVKRKGALCRCEVIKNRDNRKSKRLERIVKQVKVNPAFVCVGYNKSETYKFKCSKGHLINAFKCPSSCRRCTNIQDVKELRKNNIDSNFILYKSGNVKRECNSCGRVVKRKIKYFINKKCKCKVGESNREAHKLSWTLQKINLRIKPYDIRLVAYKGMNVKVPAICLKCNYEWSVWPGLCVKGHSCPICATKRIQKDRADWSKSKLKKILLKTQKTMLERYGVKYALQNKAIFLKMQKHSYNRYIYRLNGKNYSIQGYERYALDILKKRYKESDISLKDVPIVPYNYKGKARKYFPDIFIKSENKIIEVKSEYTMNACYKQNMAKRNACLKEGYGFEFMVFSREGKLCM